MNDLPAADAVYHQTCSTNSRTEKLCPLKFADEEQVRLVEVNSHNATLFILNKKLQNDSTTIN